MSYCLGRLTKLSVLGQPSCRGCRRTRTPSIVPSVLCSRRNSRQHQLSLPQLTLQYSDHIRELCVLSSFSQRPVCFLCSFYYLFSRRSSVCLSISTTSYYLSDLHENVTNGVSLDEEDTVDFGRIFATARSQK